MEKGSGGRADQQSLVAQLGAALGLLLKCHWGGKWPEALLRHEIGIGLPLFVIIASLHVLPLYFIVEVLIVVLSSRCHGYHCVCFQMCVFVIASWPNNYKWRRDRNRAEAGPIGGAQLCSIVAGGSEVDLVLTYFDIA